MRQCCKKMVNGRRVARVINARGLQLEYTWALHETLLMAFLMYVSETMIWKEKELEYTWALHEILFMAFLMYGSETMIWKEKERFRIKDVQMDPLRGL